MLLRVVDCAPGAEGLPEELGQPDGGWRPAALRAVPDTARAASPSAPRAGREPVRRSVAAPMTDAEARALATTRARAILEVLEGRRPLGQIAPMLGDRALSAMHTMQRGGLRWPVRHATLGSVHVLLPTAEAIEACAVFHSAQRHRALALRIARRRNLWITTAIRVG